MDDFSLLGALCAVSGRPSQLLILFGLGTLSNDVMVDLSRKVVKLDARDALSRVNAFFLFG